MTPDTKTFIAHSVKDLEPQIAKLRQDHLVKAHYAALALTGSDVLVFPFNLTNLNGSIHHHLELEAVELLSLTPKHIVLDYQIFESTKERTHGILICMPKKVMDEYTKVLLKNNLIPTNINSYYLSVINAFILDNADLKGRVCFLDLSAPHRIYCSVFNNKHCEILRDIPYETTDEAKNEIVQTFKSIVAKSATKEFNQIFYWGDIMGLGDLGGVVEALTGKKIQQVLELNPLKSAFSKKNFLKVNLLRNFSFSLERRVQLLQLTHLVAIVLIFFCIQTGLKIMNAIYKTQSVRASFSPQDYEYAVKLQKQVK